MADFSRQVGFAEYRGALEALFITNKNYILMGNHYHDSKVRTFHPARLVANPGQSAARLDPQSSAGAVFSQMFTDSLMLTRDEDNIMRGQSLSLGGGSHSSHKRKIHRRKGKNIKSKKRKNRKRKNTKKK